jgi:hypothetical protein
MQDLRLWVDRFLRRQLQNLDDPDFHVMSGEIQRNDKGKIELERI